MQISIGIGNEVKESAIQLSHMVGPFFLLFFLFFWGGTGTLTGGRGQNDAFAETGGILSGTFRRMNQMAARQGGRWMLYMLFLVLVGWIFFFVWIFR